MLGYLRRNHLGIIALVVALGGTGAYAAERIGGGEIKRNAIKKKHVAKNSISSAQIRNGKLKAADIKDGSLSGAEIADGGIGGPDIADGAVRGADVADGSLSVADIAIASGRESLGGGASGYGVCSTEYVDLGPGDYSDDIMLTTLGTGGSGGLVWRVETQHTDDPFYPEADFTIYVCNDSDSAGTKPLPDYVDWIVIRRP